MSLSALELEATATGRLKSVFVDDVIGTIPESLYLAFEDLAKRAVAVANREIADEEALEDLFDFVKKTSTIVAQSSIRRLVMVPT
jgi:hypothetical protein